MPVQVRLGHLITMVVSLALRGLDAFPYDESVRGRYVHAKGDFEIFIQSVWRGVNIMVNLCVADEKGSLNRVARLSQATGYLLNIPPAEQDCASF